jgi:putative salt-induced outer membrane protein
MYKKLGLGLSLWFCVQGTVVVAQETLDDHKLEIEQETTWKGEGELGIIQTSGNTETSNVLAQMKVSYVHSKWEHVGGFGILRSEDNDNLTAKRYDLGIQSNYELSNKRNDYLFGNAVYEEDHFSGYDYQTVITGGYGFKPIEKKIKDELITLLKLEAGIGARQSRLAEEVDGNREVIGRLALEFRQKVGAHSQFIQTLLTISGSDNTLSQSYTAFKVQVMDHLAVNLSFAVKHNTEVPEENKNTDTISAVTLVYNF